MQYFQLNYESLILSAGKESGESDGEIFSSALCGPWGGRSLLTTEAQGSTEDETGYLSAAIFPEPPPFAGVKMNNPAARDPSVDPHEIAIESDFDVAVPGRTGYFGTLLRV